MKNNFVKKNNTAIALSLLLRDMLEADEMKLSAWFEPKFVKKTLHTRTEFNQILNKAFKTADVNYVDSISTYATLINNFTDLIFETQKTGKQELVLNEIDKIFIKNGLKLLPK